MKGGQRWGSVMVAKETRVADQQKNLSVFARLHFFFDTVTERLSSTPNNGH